MSNYDSRDFQRARHAFKKSIRRADLISEKIDDCIESGVPMREQVLSDLSDEIQQLPELWNEYNRFLIREA